MGTKIGSSIWSPPADMLQRAFYYGGLGGSRRHRGSMHKMELGEVYFVKVRSIDNW